MNWKRIKYLGVGVKYWVLAFMVKVENNDSRVQTAAHFYHKNAIFSKYNIQNVKSLVIG